MSEEHHGVWPQSWDLHGCITVCLSNSVTSSFVIISSEKQPDPLVMAIREFSVLWGTSARACSRARTHIHTHTLKGKERMLLHLVRRCTISYSNHISSFGICVQFATSVYRDGIILTTKGFQRRMLGLGASLAAQLVKNPPAIWEDPWVGKIAWKRERLPTPVDEHDTFVCAVPHYY